MRPRSFVRRLASGRGIALTAALAGAAVAVAIILPHMGADRSSVQEARLPRGGASSVDIGPAEAPALAAWRSLDLAGADEVESYTSLADMTAAADLVAVATVGSVAPGRVVGEKGDPLRFVTVILRIDRALSSDGAAPTSVPVEFGPFGGIDADETWLNELVGDRGLFFLRLKGAGVPELGIPPDPAEQSLGYYRVVNSGGLFVHDRGTAEAVLYQPELEGATTSFVTALDGSSFEALVSTVAELAGR